MQFMLSIAPSTVVWYVGHAILFLWFSMFISPMKQSDRANVTYFWFFSFTTLILLISMISHAPRLFHSTSSRLVDIVAFAWAVVPVTAILLDMLSKISRRFLGYSINSPLRAYLSNTLLVTIALSLQYMTCLDHGYLEPEIGRAHV